MLGEGGQPDAGRMGAGRTGAGRMGAGRMDSGHSDAEYLAFRRIVRRLIDVDLASYRQGQMRRRLEALVERIGASGFLDYARRLERDPARLQEFRDYFTINVTEFFRDPERFRALETVVLPELIRRRPALRVWSAACSTGAEPYSVAILLKELAPAHAHTIVATDVDPTIVERARRGDGYLDADVRGVSSVRLARAFERGGAGSYAIKPEYRMMVDVRLHNLLMPPPSRGFDLILCRNVVIYFTDEAKAALYRHLADALRPGEVLFVGGTEMVAGARGLGLAAAGPSFYRKDDGRVASHQPMAAAIRPSRLMAATR